MIAVGVIGYGYWGPNLVRNFAEVPGGRVGFVTDTREARLSQVSTRLIESAKTTPDVAVDFFDKALQELQDKGLLVKS